MDRHSMPGWRPLPMKTSRKCPAKGGDQSMACIINATLLTRSDRVLQAQREALSKPGAFVNVLRCHRLDNVARTRHISPAFKRGWHKVELNGGSKYCELRNENNQAASNRLLLLGVRSLTQSTFHVLAHVAEAALTYLRLKTWQ